MAKKNDEWDDPMYDDYRNPRINSYKQGLGLDLQSKSREDEGRLNVDNTRRTTKPQEIFVGNVPLDMDELALQNLFAEYGKVLRVAIPKPTPENERKYRSKVGFVTMESTRSAMDAIQHLNNLKIRDMFLRVQIKKSKELVERDRQRRAYEADVLRNLTTGRVEENDASANGTPGGITNGQHSGHMNGAGDASQVLRNTAFPPPSVVPPAHDRSDLTITLNSNTGRKVASQLNMPATHQPGKPQPMVQNSGFGAGILPASIKTHTSPAASGDSAEDLCASCGKRGLKRCTGCKLVHYCSVLCQRAHWAVHKNVCAYNAGVQQQKQPAPQPSRPVVLQPDFANMVVDVDENFVKVNRKYFEKLLVSQTDLEESDSDSSEAISLQFPLSKVMQQAGKKAKNKGPASGKEREQGQHKGGRRERTQSGSTGSSDSPNPSKPKPGRDQRQSSASNAQRSTMQQQNKAMPQGPSFEPQNSAMPQGPSFGQQNSAMSQGPSFGQQNNSMPQGPSFGQQNSAMPQGPSFGQQNNSMPQGPSFGQQNSAMPQGPSFGQQNNSMPQGPSFGQQGSAPQPNSAVPHFGQPGSGPQGSTFTNVTPHTLGPREERFDSGYTSQHGSFTASPKSDAAAGNVRMEKELFGAEKSVINKWEQKREGKFQSGRGGQGGNWNRDGGNRDRDGGKGDRGFGNQDRGGGNRDRNFGNGDRGRGNRDRNFGNGDRGRGNRDRDFGNRDNAPYAGEPHQNRGPNRNFNGNNSNQGDDATNEDGLLGARPGFPPGEPAKFQEDQPNPRSPRNQDRPNNSGGPPKFLEDRPIRMPPRDEEWSDNSGGSPKFQEGRPNQRPPRNEDRPNNRQGDRRQNNQRGGRPFNQPNKGRFNKPVEESWNDESETAKETSVAEQKQSTAVVTPKAASEATTAASAGPVKVVVSHMDSPQSFWVQEMQLGVQVLTKVSEVLQNYTPVSGTVKMAQKGELVLSLFDGFLCRARVERVQDSQVTIFYVDYGNSEVATLERLMPIPAEIASLPPVAMHCSLQVVPVEGMEWSPDVAEILRLQYPDGKLSDLTSLKKTGELIEVTLVRSDDGMDATQFLIENGLAMAPTAKQPPPAKQPPAEKPTRPVASMPQRVLAANMRSKSSELHVGQYLDMLLMETTGPMDLFMRLVACENAFQQFSAKMIAHYNTLPEMPYAPMLGELVICRFSEDKAWYRAEVKAITVDKQAADLFYVDFGNKETLPFSELRPAEPDYTSLSIHGIRCGIGGVSAPAGGQWKDEHLPAYMESMQKYVVPVEGGLKCSVVIENIKNGVVWVDLVDQEHQQTLSEDLVNLLEASLLPQPIQPQVVPPSPSATPMAQPTFAAGAEAAKPYETTKALSEEMASSSQEAMKSLAEQELGKCLDVESLPFDQTVVCGVQEVVSCEEFYVTKHKSEETLNSLRAELNKYCAGPSSEQVTSAQPGTLVLVQFSADNEWYRGRVDSVSADNVCDVFFIDYGNREDKSAPLLRVLPPCFAEVPMQAIKCRLGAVTSPITQEVDAKFKSLCQQTEGLVRVMGRQGDTWSVELLTADHQSMAVLLDLCPPLEEQADSVLAVDDRVSPSLLPEASSPSPARLITSPTPSPAQSMSSPTSFPTQPIPSPTPSPVYLSDRVVLTRGDVTVVAVDSTVLDSMMVTHVVSPSQFYCNDANSFMAQLQENGLQQELGKLNATSTPITNPPQLGELLCAPFEDGWYRCEVVEVMTPKVRVNFFDYGNEAVVETSDLRPLPKALCDSYPITTLKCCVHGVKPASGDDWDEECVQLLKTMLLNQLVTLTVRKKVEDAYLVAVTISGEDLKATLIECEKAVHKPSQNPWFDEECEAINRARKRAEGKWLLHRTDENKKAHQKLRAQSRYIYKLKKTALAEKEANKEAEKEALLRQMQELQAKLASLGN